MFADRLRLCLNWILFTIKLRNKNEEVSESSKKGHTLCNVMDTEHRICVAIRIRPPLERERYDTTCARRMDDGCSIVMTNNEDHSTTSFGFDFCFDESDDQRGIYEEAVQEMVDAGLQGNNATIFTYGQTGSGKTYTILGNMSEGGSLSAESGLFLRVFGDLFEYRRRVASKAHVLISLSAVELYVEDVMDLLSNKAKIRLRDSGDETLLTGLNRVEVNDMRDVMRQFRVANSFRSVAATKMNDASSRSHALFFIDIFQVPLESMDMIRAAVGTKASMNSSLSSSTGPVPISALVDEFGNPKSAIASHVKKSRIALVDLAGSERVKRSGVEGQAMTEAQAINKSLSTLGTVINAMYFQSSHVPFRESKLTKVLKSSFVDRTSRLLLIGQVAPASGSLAESLGTLRFCDRVKNLKVAAATAFVDPEEENRYLEALRNCEALCADLRIAQCAHYYEPQRPRFHAIKERKSAEAYIKEILPTLQATAPNKERTVEERHLQHIRREATQECEATIQEYRTKQQRLLKESQDLDDEGRQVKGDGKRHKEELDAALESKMNDAKKMKKARLNAEDKATKLKETLKTIEEQLTGVRRELSVAMSPERRPPVASPSGDKAVKKKKKNTSAASGEKHHGFDDDEDAQTSTPTPSSLAPPPKPSNNFDDDDDDADEENSRGASPAVGGAVSPSLDGATTDPSEHEWMQFERDWHQAEANHEVVSDFYFHVKTLNPLHVEYVSLLKHNWVAWGDASRLRFRNSEVLQSSTLIPDIVAFITERAVLIAEQVIDANDTFAWFDIDGMSRKLKSAYEIVPPLLTDNMKDPIPIGPVETHTATFLDDTEDDGEADGNADAATIANRRQLGLTQGAGGGAGVASAATTKEAREKRKRMKGNGATKKYDTEEADREYLMTVYDSCTLVHDVTKYLKAGTIMLKHGRRGSPHDRLFWVTVASFRMELVWIDPANRTGERACISLNDVGHISLGCFGKVFRRNPYPNTDKNFFFCFTVALKDGGRTVDIVAPSLPDFEAWVLGLCHLARIDPYWGKPLDISTYPEANGFSPEERALCEQHYIFPTHYQKIKEKVVGLRDEVHLHLRLFGNDHEQAYASLGGIHLPQVNDQGAVLMTKGELRYHCSPFQTDIFRVCKIWIQFHRMGIIYDPSFTPPTNFGLVTR